MADTTPIPKVMAFLKADSDAGAVAQLEAMGAATASGLTAEATARTSGDTALAASITSAVATEAAARTAAISSEAAARASADTALAASVTNEAVVRASADSALTSALSAEAAARSSADAMKAAASLTDPAQLRALGDGIIHGTQFLSYWHNRLIAGSACKIVCSGDSTTAGDGSTAPYRIWELLPEAALARGFEGVTAVNRGQSGKHTGEWVSTYLAGDLALNPDVLILRWGVNDPAYGRSATDFRTSLRAGLATVRASRAVSALSIILCTPNPTSDTPNARDATWYESIIGIVKEAAADYQCCFVDCYSQFRNITGAATVFMDNPYGDGRAIHPYNVFNIQLVGLQSDALFPRSLSDRIGSNAHYNIPGSLSTPAAASAGTTYPKGLSAYRATSGGGWPHDGCVLTHRHTDGQVFQTNFAYIGTSPEYSTRQWKSSGAVWSAWVLTNAPALNVVAGTGFTSPGSEKMSCTSDANLAYGAGYLSQTAPGAIAAGVVIGTVPAGRRPVNYAAYGISLSAWSSGTTWEYVRADILSDGSITLRTPVTISATRIYFSGGSSWRCD